MKTIKSLLILFLVLLCCVAVSCSGKTICAKENNLTTKQITSLNSLSENEFSINKKKLDEQYDNLFLNNGLSNIELTEEIAKLSDKWDDLSKKYIELFENRYTIELNTFQGLHSNTDTKNYFKTYKDFMSKIDEKNNSELEMFRSLNDVITGGSSSSVAVAKYDYKLSREKTLKIYEIYNLLGNL